MNIILCSYAKTDAPDDFCADLVERLLAGECPHGHTFIAGFCATHAEQVMATRTLCRSCWLDHDQPHRCRMIASEVVL